MGSVGVKREGLMRMIGMESVVREGVGVGKGCGCEEVCGEVGVGVGR